jgi:Asp-tRNA(Asn)/Glu-tRNA(Gln) amidotransferase A subunit family amidase
VAQSSLRVRSGQPLDADRGRDALATDGETLRLRSGQAAGATTTMSDKSIIELSACEMAARIRAREFSSLELIDAHLAQIERVNPVLNAYVQVRVDEAREEARQADALLVSGTELGPLHGVPISIKSSIDVAGMRCEAGSRLRKGNIPSKDATLVERLKAAGAVVLGVTSAPEFLMAWETDNALYGRTNNPLDLTRTAGGSSGGESAAIAACMSAGGVGSDGGGSIRVPAHYTGICGLKPTPGRVPSTGHFPPGVGGFSWLGAVGPMARTVDDLHRLLGVMAGEDLADPNSAPVPLVEIEANELKHTRVGLMVEDRVHPVTPETRAAVEAAAAALRDAGFVVEPCQPPLLDRVHKLWVDVFVRMIALAFQPIVKGNEAELSPIFREYLEYAASLPALTADEILTLLAERDIVRAHFLKETERYPILLMPVAPGPAFRHGEIGWFAANHCATFVETFAYTQWFNLLGCPAATVPVARSNEGLPIGVQVVGRPFDDELVLAVAKTVESRFCLSIPRFTMTAPAISQHI